MLAQYRSGDIIIATFPKCGTTWIEQCVLLLLADGYKEGLNPATKNVYIPGSTAPGKVWLEAALQQDPSYQHKTGLEFAPISVQNFMEMPGSRVIKTHAPMQLLLGTDNDGLSALPDGVKVVVMTRNPMDACVSCYYHAWNPFKSGWPFEAWATYWLGGYSVHGSWFTWVKDWYLASQAHPQTAHFMQYENMKKNAAEEVRKLADFLCIDHTPELISRVVENSSFDSMRGQAEECGGDKMGHLRKGESGDWRNHFVSEPLIQAFRSKFDEEVWATTGLEPMFE
eukprot:gene32754-40427_t